MDYKERLLIELIQVASRIAKLDMFLENNSIDNKEKLELMQNQLNVMMEYRNILQKRILLEMN